MATEYRLSYTATEIDEKLGKIDSLVATVNGIAPDENGNVQIPGSGGNVDYCNLYTIGKKIISGAYSKIVLMGDSITDGHGGTGYNGSYSPALSTNTNGYCWANAFKKHIGGKFGLTVENKGMHGTVAAAQVNAAKNYLTGSELVIWLSGTNNRGGIENYADTMGQYIEEIKARCADLLVMSCIPAGAENETSKASTSADICAVLVAETIGKTYFLDMRKEYIRYCENFGLTIEETLSDGLHPNDTGYWIMFKLLCDNIGISLSTLTTYKQDSEWWGTIVECTGISLSVSELNFTAEGSQTITATVTPDGCTDAVTWESNNTNVATVSNGVVTAKANGFATITAKCGKYSASCSVSISGVAESVACTGISLSKTSISFTDLETQTITATVTPSNCTEEIIWSSSNVGVAKVSGGVITAVADGNAVITAKCGQYSAECAVTVETVITENVVTLTETTTTLPSLDKGTILSKNGGADETHDACYTTNYYVAVDENVSYTISIARSTYTRINSYDSNFAFKTNVLSGDNSIETYEYTVPAGVRYIRISVYNYSGDVTITKNA